MTNVNTTMTTEPKKIVSMIYEETKETHDEIFTGAFDTLRIHHDLWVKAIGNPLSNKELKVTEKELKKGGAYCICGNSGSVVTFYFDKKTSKFVGFIHRPKMLVEAAA